MWRKRKNLILLLICFIIETCIISYWLNYYNRKDYNAYNEEAYQYLEDIAEKIEANKTSLISLPENVSGEVSKDGKIVYVTLHYNEKETVHQKSIFEKLACSVNKVTLYLIYNSDGSIASMKREYDSKEYMLNFIFVYAILFGLIATFLTWVVFQIFKTILKPVYPRKCIN